MRKQQVVFFFNWEARRNRKDFCCSYRWFEC